MSTVYKPDFVARSAPPDEQEVRVDVAAAYRLAAHYKLDDFDLFACHGARSGDDRSVLHSTTWSVVR
jgi:hypothetical protein